MNNRVMRAMHYIQQTYEASSGQGTGRKELELTEAVATLHHNCIELEQGYRIFDIAEYPEIKPHEKALVVAVHADRILNVLSEWIDALAAITTPYQEEALLDVLLTSSHEVSGEASQTQSAAGIVYCRQGIKKWLVQRALEEFRDGLTNDGCCDIAVLHHQADIEVRLDDHKLLVVYTDNAGLQPFINILRDYGVVDRPGIAFINQYPHMHSSTNQLQAAFHRLCAYLGAEFDDELNTS